MLPDFDGEIAMDDAPFVVEDLVLPTDPTIIEKEEMQDSTVKGDETFSELFEKYDQTYNSNDKYGTSGDFKNDVLETIQTIVHEAKQGKDLKNPMTLMNQEAILSSNDTSMKRHHQVIKPTFHNISNKRLYLR